MIVFAVVVFNLVAALVVVVVVVVLLLSTARTVEIWSWSWCAGRAEHRCRQGRDLGMHAKSLFCFSSWLAGEGEEQGARRSLLLPSS